MELDKFIESTIIQIIDGVRAASANEKYLVAPHTVRWAEYETQTNLNPNIIEFEVALILGSESSGGIDKILVARSTKTEKSTHIVKFTVPVYYHGSRSTKS